VSSRTTSTPGALSALLPYLVLVAVPCRLSLAFMELCLGGGAFSILEGLMPSAAPVARLPEKKVFMFSNKLIFKRGDASDTVGFSNEFAGSRRLGCRRGKGASQEIWKRITTSRQSSIQLTLVQTGCFNFRARMPILYFKTDA